MPRGEEGAGVKSRPGDRGEPGFLGRQSWVMLAAGASGFCFLLPRALLAMQDRR